MLERMLWGWLDKRRQKREEMDRRIASLKERAAGYNFLPLAEHIRDDVLNLRPHRAFVDRAVGQADISYPTIQKVNTEAIRHLTIPNFAGSLLELQDGYFEWHPSERPEFDKKYFNVVTIALTEDGAFHFQYLYQKPTILGTTESIRTARALRSSVDRTLRALIKQ